MSGKSSRDKGRRGEYKIRDILNDRGFLAWRQPLSGSQEGYEGDIVCCPHSPQHNKNRCPHPVVLEVKWRGRLPAYLTRWQGQSNALVLIEDRAEPRVQLTIYEYCNLLRKAYQRMPR